MGRRDKLPDIDLIGAVAPAADPSHAEVHATVRRGRPSRPVQQRDTDWWRWGLALAVVVAIVIAVITFDRRSDPPQATAPTTTTPAQVTPTSRSGVAESDLPLPSGLSGTLYSLGEDETLVEVDLPTGRSRIAALQFPVEPWFVNQVVALEDVVLVTTRRQVFSVDRATLADQHQVADQRWVVGSPDGSWAALVPFGGNVGPITIIDGKGAAIAAPLQLPSGVSVQGAVDDGLVLDSAGTLQILRPDGTPGPTLGTGKFVASGHDSVARMVCQPLSCELHTGTVAQPDARLLGGVELIGPWYFGPAGVFDPLGTRLAVVSPDTGRDGIVRTFDLTPGAAGTATDSPVAPNRSGALPALAFSADGSTLVHPSAEGVALWNIAGGQNGQAAVQQLAFPGRQLAVTVTPQPPPPPPQSSGPPPSFA